MKELTKAEEQIMQVLWKIKKGVVHDVMGHLPQPIPAYTTVSTIIRILEQKGFVDHKAYGRTHEYFPLISKEEYTRTFLRGFVSGYFNDSYKALASFFAKDEKLSLTELEAIRQLMEEAIDKKKTLKDNGKAY